MVKQASFPVEIVPCSTVRNPGGLAMSSRNMRLTTLQKVAAERIYQRLSSLSEMKKYKSIAVLKTWMHSVFLDDEDLVLEYFEISDPVSLQATKEWSDCDTHIACIAVFVGEVRLIDNILLKIN